MIDFEREMENDGLIECPACEGDGGWDVATDPEVYDHWVDCPDCSGEGRVSPQ